MMVTLGGLPALFLTKILLSQRLSITIKIKDDNFIDNYVQLDGSHRRCVSSYLAIQKYTLVVTLGDQALL